MTFTKAHIAQKIGDDCGFMKGEAVEIFEKMLEIMKAKLAAGEDLMISSFEKWSVKSKRARKGRIPKTGEEIVLHTIGSEGNHKPIDRSEGQAFFSI
ncbi:MAG: HU family DNA-binding protein [Desulfomonilaceae bacterium]